MMDKKTKLTFDQMLKEVNKGNLLMGVDPALARQFYTDLTNTQRLEKTGNSQSTQATTVTLLLDLETISLTTASVSAIFALNWWAFAAIPILVFTWMYWKSTSSMGKPKFGSAIFLFLCGIAAAIYLSDLGTSFIIMLAVAPLPNIFIKMVYHFSGEYLRNLAMNREQAFNFLFGNTAVYFLEHKTGKIIKN